ncbi:hypothetical protein SKAU_G00113670 [Synaphobranchus kaupii]|uniref:PNPLA domain-containing protein n=1 Tax=Synaphobranchus kaupii TaxID=118154 RepID=A0A9Q1G1N4_SYNKA|nr:hypothetical protein SKAU_G00113670 [Synaphobranchus kaupii]
MGPYLNTCQHLAHLDRRTAKLRYLLVILRTLPCMATPPLTPSRHTCRRVSPLSPSHPTLTGTALPKLGRLKRGGFGWLAGDSSRNVHRSQIKCLVLRHLCAVRAYSTSRPGSGPGPGPSRKASEADAPIGVLEETKVALQLGYLGERLGESFQLLSRHINSYFNEPATPALAPCGRAWLVSGEQGRRGKRHRSEGPANERAGPGGGALGRAEASANQTEERPPAQAGEGVELFHISSFATRLGESYSYVARHINAAFSTGVARDTWSETVTDKTASLRMRGRRKRRSTEIRSGSGGTGRGSGPVQLAEAVGSEQDPRVWDEGYLHFARRINSYFGAKVTDAKPEPMARFRSFATTTRVSDPAGSPTDSALGLKGPSPAANWETAVEAHRPRSPGLFHISNLATSFGESYTQMAHHVNRYFKGQESFDEEGEEGGGGGSGSRVAGGGVHLRDPPGKSTVLHSDGHLRPVGELYGGGGGSAHSHFFYHVEHTGHFSTITMPVTNRRRAEEQTRVLVKKLQQAAGPASLHACVEELNHHLILYPACTAVAWQEKAVLQLLAQRRFHGDNQEIQGAIRETLALIGYVDSVKGRGIRILSIDGGGTRGVVPLQVLKRLEAATGRQVHQLFDYICGVSTGAVLAFMLGLVRVSLEECEETYHRFGADVFRQNPLVGTVKMGWSHSYYDTPTWEGLLREKMGSKILIKTAREQLSPKVSAVSAVVNWGTTPKAFVFRNYNHAPGRLSRYAGASGYQLWQAIRASSAAPGYFQEFPLHSDIHQDGALILNNPCALAVHESRLLWPTRPFQCVLSLGTGRYDNAKRGPVTSTSLRSKISNLISSATDTEGVHTLLDDLLSANIYFRFNPMLSAEVSMDESRPGTLDLLRADTQFYLDRNQCKVDRLCRALGPERGALQLAGDWIGERAWELRQRWA